MNAAHAAGCRSNAQVDTLNVLSHVTNAHAGHRWWKSSVRRCAIARSASSAGCSIGRSVFKANSLPFPIPKSSTRPNPYTFMCRSPQEIRRAKSFMAQHHAVLADMSRQAFSSKRHLRFSGDISYSRPFAIHFTAYTPRTVICSTEACRAKTEHGARPI